MDRNVRGPRAAVGAIPKRVAFLMDAKAWPGGAEVWLSGLMSGLAARGWEIRFLLSDRRVTDEWARQLSERGIAVARFRPTREVDPRGVREARRLLAGFEIVHVNKPHPRMCLPAIAAARSAGAKIVVTTEHIVMKPESRYPFGPEMITYLVRRANRVADLITVTSDVSRMAYIENYRAPARKVVSVRTGVDLARFDHGFDVARLRESLGLAPDDVVGVCVARLFSGKGVDTLLRAVPLILERVPQFRLVVAGTGPLADALERLRGELGVASSVLLVGSRHDVPLILRAGDIFLLASESESAGIAVLEAMAARLPVVATAVGGLCEAVDDGVTGRLVPPRNPRAVADATVAVLSREDRGASLGIAGRRKVETAYASSAVVGRVLELYEELWARRGASTGE
jgi:glycosyltransferase involved in cell wall biosynthesis